MTGKGLPWNKQAKTSNNDDSQRLRDLQQRQSDLESQQTAELKQQKKRLNNQQISLLRSRFGVSGSPSTTGQQAQTDTASNLFARITGR